MVKYVHAFLKELPKYIYMLYKHYDSSSTILLNSKMKMRVKFPINYEYKSFILLIGQSGAK